MAPPAATYAIHDMCFGRCFRILSRRMSLPCSPRVVWNFSRKYLPGIFFSSEQLFSMSHWISLVFFSPEGPTPKRPVKTRSDISNNRIALPKVASAMASLHLLERDTKLTIEDRLVKPESLIPSLRILTCYCMRARCFRRIPLARAPSCCPCSGYLRYRY